MSTMQLTPQANELLFVGFNQVRGEGESRKHDTVWFTYYVDEALTQQNRTTDVLRVELKRALLYIIAIL